MLIVAIEYYVHTINLSAAPLTTALTNILDRTPNVSATAGLPID